MSSLPPGEPSHGAPRTVSTLRAPSIRVVVATVCLSGGCGPSAEPRDHEVYSAVLEELSGELDLQAPVSLHPLVGRLDAGRRDGEIMPEFLELDTLLVPAVVSRDPESYRLCRTTSTGSCVTPDGRPWLILSEIADRGRHTKLVVVLVRDPRSGRRALRSFAGRVRHSRSGGLSVRLEEIP